MDSKTKYKPETTQEKIFRSALLLFAEKGYHGTTVRDICRHAGAANINSINYYYGSKEKLYRHILEFMYSEFSRRKAEYPDHIPPEQHLRDFITAYCEMEYTDNEYTRAFVAISNAEMTRPSPWMKTLVKKYVKQQSLDILGVIRKLLGPGVPEDAVRDCCLDLHIAGEQDIMAFVKDFQRHPVTGKILHLDLFKVTKSEKIKTHVPVELVGTPAGLKLGGILKFVERELMIHCLPGNLPEKITIDIAKMVVGDTIHVRDIVHGSEFEILTTGNNVVVAVEKPKAVADEVESVEQAEEAAPAADAGKE